MVRTAAALCGAWWSLLGLSHAAHGHALPDGPPACVVVASVEATAPAEALRGLPFQRWVLQPRSVEGCFGRRPSEAIAPVSLPGLHVVGSVAAQPGDLLELHLTWVSARHTWYVSAVRAASDLHEGHDVQQVAPRLWGFRTDNRGPDGSPLRWREPVVRWAWAGEVPEGMSAQQVDAALEAVVETWSGVPCSGVVLRAEGRQEHDAGGARNVVRFFSDGFSEVGQSNVLATTGLAYSEEGEILNAFVQVNAETIPWSLGDGPESPRYDLRGVLLHEVGHALGLAHTPHPEATMFGAMPPRQTRAVQALHEDDVAGLCFLYPCRYEEGCSGYWPRPDPATRSGAGLCATCAEDGECGGARDRCSPEGTCGRQCHEGWPCPAGFVCAEPREAGQTSQCRALDRLCARREAALCQPCDDTTPCAAGTCQGGRCRLSCDDDVACPPGGRCVEVEPGAPVCVVEAGYCPAPEPPRPPSAGAGCGCAAQQGVGGLAWYWALLLVTVRRRRGVAPRGSEGAHAGA